MKYLDIWSGTSDHEDLLQKKTSDPEEQRTLLHRKLHFEIFASSSMVVLIISPPTVLTAFSTGFIKVLNSPPMGNRKHINFALQSCYSVCMHSHVRRGKLYCSLAQLVADPWSMSESVPASSISLPVCPSFW